MMKTGLAIDSDECNLHWKFSVIRRRSGFHVIIAVGTILILDAGKTETCPFEKLAENFSDPEEAYKKLKEKLKETLS